MKNAKTLHALCLAGALCASPLMALAQTAPTAPKPSAPASTPAPAKPAAASAQAPKSPARDGKAVAEDKDVANYLKQAVGQVTTSEEIARKIGPLIYADNRLTAQESDLILELLANRDSTITVTGPDGTSFKVPALSKAAHDFLALSDPPDLNTLWMQGTEKMKQLIDVTLLNPYVAGQVQNYIGQNLYTSWRTSSASNNFKPLRDTVRVALAQWRGTGQATEKQAHKLLHDALVQVNNAVDRKIPKDLIDSTAP
jgi:hypothetical protein